jgi:hypothetical protein
MSVWLGAPARKMKMQFFAVLRSVGAAFVVAPRRRRGSKTSAKYDATMPVPAIRKKWRREKLIRTGTPDC